MVASKHACSISSRSFWTSSVRLGSTPCSSSCSIHNHSGKVLLRFSRPSAIGYFAIGTKVIAQEHLKKLSWELLITHIHLDSSDITEQSLLLILLLLVLVYVVYIPSPPSPPKRMKKALRDKHCTLAVVRRSQTFLPHHRCSFPGAQDGQNLISWRWSLPSLTDQVWRR